jgi:hypothetical protein
LLSLALAGGLVWSAVLANPTPAAATWANSDVTALEFRDVCRDGIRFGGAVTGSFDPAAEAFPGVAIAVQPAPPDWRSWVGETGLAMRTPITIPAAAADTVIDLGDYTSNVSHIGSYTLPYQRRPLRLGEPVALNLKNGDPDTSVNTADVTDCLLYAPIDVQPGMSPNKVPVGRGRVSVAVLATSSLAPNRLDPGSFRFGPRKAQRQDSALRDVNGDRKKDLVLRFGSVAAGIRCSTRTVRLTGNTPSGGKLEASGRVAPTGCG